MTDKNLAAYLETLENKIVDLSLELKSKNNVLNSLKNENFNHIKKLVHNLKNPIGIAFSFSEMIAENPKNLSIEKLEQYIDIIQNSTKYSIEILNAIATINRLKAPAFLLNFNTVNYVDFLNENLNEIQQEFDQKNIAIIKDFPSKSISLSIDSNEIKLLISNLLNNALRFSPINSTINISIHETSDAVETVISDQGIGISENNLPLVFNEFFVVNTYCENNEKCIGLGLSIAKLIANYHNSKIEVSRNLDQGVSFKLTIPKKIA